MVSSLRRRTFLTTKIFAFLIVTTSSCRFLFVHMVVGFESGPRADSLGALVHVFQKEGKAGFALILFCQIGGSVVEGRAGPPWAAGSLIAV